MRRLFICLFTLLLITYAGFLNAATAQSVTNNLSSAFQNIFSSMHKALSAPPVSAANDSAQSRNINDILDDSDKITRSTFFAQTDDLYTFTDPKNTNAAKKQAIIFFDGADLSSNANWASFFFWRHILHALHYNIQYAPVGTPTSAGQEACSGDAYIQSILAATSRNYSGTISVDCSSMNPLQTNELDNRIVINNRVAGRLAGFNDGSIPILFLAMKDEYNNTAYFLPNAFFAGGTRDLLNNTVFPESLPSSRPIQGLTDEFLLRSTYRIPENKSESIRLYSFLDPNCTFCHEQWLMFYKWRMVTLSHVQSANLAIIPEGGFSTNSYQLAGQELRDGYPSVSADYTRYQSGIESGGLALDQGLTNRFLFEAYYNSFVAQTLGAHGFPFNIIHKKGQPLQAFVGLIRKKPKI
jgi:hypothetical protein